MKKKIVSISIVVTMLAIAIVGGTLAYFTDTEKAENVFTSGKVDIKLNDVFNQNSKLIPGIKVDKKTSITLEEGSEDAWVWFEYLVPAALDDSGITGNISAAVPQALQWNLNPRYLWNVRNWWNTNNPSDQNNEQEKSWDNAPAVNGLANQTNGYVGDETVDGINYHKYVVVYLGKLSHAEGGQVTTTECLNNVRFAKEVDCNAQGQYTYKGDVIENFPTTVKVIVRAYAIQAAGFDSVYDAYNAYQG